MLTMNPADKKWCGSRSIIHLCAAQGATTQLENALKEGKFHANETSIDNITPLHEASFNGHLSCAKLLIKYGANVNARNIENSTPLNEAVCKGNLEIAKLLIANGAETNPLLTQSSPLHDAALSNQESCLELLIHNGANVLAQDCHYGTALHISCFKQNYNCVKLLLNSGSNVNAQKQHMTPLHYATDGYHGESSDAIIRLLLNAGADSTLKSSLGRRPIDRVPPMSNAAKILRKAMYEPKSLTTLANIAVRNQLQPIRKNIKSVEWLPHRIRQRILLD